MEADQGRWDTLDEYLAHYTAYIVNVQLKKSSRLKPQDILMRPRKAGVPTMSERREFFEDFTEKHGTPRKHR